MNPSKLHPDDRVYIFDDIGLLAIISPSQTTAALRRREIRPTDHPDRFRLIPRPLNELTGAERRRLEQKKVRSRRPGLR